MQHIQAFHGFARFGFLGGNAGLMTFFKALLARLFEFCLPACLRLLELLCRRRL